MIRWVLFVRSGIIGPFLLRPRVYYVIFQHCFSVYALICIYAGRELITGKPWRSA